MYKLRRNLQEKSTSSCDGRLGFDWHCWNAFETIWCEEWVISAIELSSLIERLPKCKLDGKKNQLSCTIATALGTLGHVQLLLRSFYNWMVNFCEPKKTQFPLNLRNCTLHPTIPPLKHDLLFIIRRPYWVCKGKSFREHGMEGKMRKWLSYGACRVLKRWGESFDVTKDYLSGEITPQLVFRF